MLVLIEVLYEFMGIKVRRIEVFWKRRDLLAVLTMVRRRISREEIRHVLFLLHGRLPGIVATATSKHSKRPMEPLVKRALLLLTSKVPLPRHGCKIASVLEHLGKGYNVVV